MVAPSKLTNMYDSTAFAAPHVPSAFGVQSTPAAGDVPLVVVAELDDNVDLLVVVDGIVVDVKTSLVDGIVVDVKTSLVDP